MTGVFHSRKALVDAAEEMLLSGIDRTETDVSASIDALGHRATIVMIEASASIEPAIRSQTVLPLLGR
jgi:hypothetical protein